MRIPSTDPFWKNNMTSAMCRHCEIFNTCEKHDNLPRISPLSAYLIRWHTEHQAGFTSYPQAGTWQNQAPWFMDGLDKVRSTMASEQERQHQEMVKRYGNK